MFAPRFHLSAPALNARWAPILIALGLAQLAAGIVWHTVPVVTALTLIALGATLATIDRFRTSPALPSVLLLHSAVYGSLYILFIGASLDAAMRADAPMGWPSVVDLAVSMPLAAAAAGTVLIALRDSRATEY
jgi:hypothetical protein